MEISLGNSGKDPFVIDQSENQVMNHESSQSDGETPTIVLLQCLLVHKHPYVQTSRKCLQKPWNWQQKWAGKNSCAPCCLELISILAGSPKPIMFDVRSYPYLSWEDHPLPSQGFGWSCQLEALPSLQAGQTLPSLTCFSLWAANLWERKQLERVIPEVSPCHVSPALTRLLFHLDLR